MNYTHQIGFYDRHIVRQARREEIRIRSQAGYEWMIEAMKTRELIRRRGSNYVVVGMSAGRCGVTASLHEVILVEMPKKREIPAPSMYC